MAECLECLDNLSLEDLISLVTTCDEGGNVAWRLYEVDAAAEDCHSCTQFNSIEDLVRKSLYCDDDGVFYLRINITS